MPDPQFRHALFPQRDWPDVPHPSTLLCADERRRDQPDHPDEPAAITNAKDDDKHAQAAPGATLSPMKTRGNRTHPLATSVVTPFESATRSPEATGLSADAQRTEGPPLRPPRPHSRRLLRPRPREVSHNAAAENEAASRRQPESVR